MIDELIRQGPLLNNREDLPADRLLEFGDVRWLIAKDSTFNPPALFVTATNVTGRRLVVFNSIDDQYQNIPIAKTVRALAGFPAFFRPVEFKDGKFAGWYADGGIVSNYPAWIFSKEFRIRLLDAAEYRPLASRPWAHFGLRLGRTPVGHDRMDTSPKLYASSLARLLLAGEARSELEGRLENLVTRTFTVQQPDGDTGVPPNVDLLDVDRITQSIVRDMYNCGRRAGDRLGDLEYRLPEPKDIEPLLKALIESRLLVLRQTDNAKLLFRSNVFIPSKKTLFIQYSVNMDGSLDRDKDLQLRFDTRATASK